MDGYIITALSSALLILLSITGYLYNKIQQRNDDELTKVADQYETLNVNMMQGFKEIREVMSGFNNRLSLEESRQEMWQENYEKISLATDKLLEKFDTRIKKLEDTVGYHNLDIGVLKKTVDELSKKNTNT